MNDEQLSQRLRAASHAIEMSDSAQARHLEAIAAALPGQAQDAAIPIGDSGRERRRRFVAAVAAAALIGPAGLAAASDGTVPGDTLYPIKQLSERVLVLFDSEVIARHRIEELEAMDDADSSHPGLLEEARTALTELGEGHPLWDRLAATRDVPAGPAVGDDDRSEAQTPRRVDVRLPDGATATLTISDGELADVVAPRGWNVSELDDDGATLVSDSFEVELRVHRDGSVEIDTTRLDDDASETDDDVSEDVADHDDDSEAATPAAGAGHDDDSDDDDVSDGGTAGDDASSDD